MITHWDQCFRFGGTGMPPHGGHMAAQALAGSLGLTVRLPVTGPPPTVKQLQLAAGAAESVVDVQYNRAA